MKKIAGKITFLTLLFLSCLPSFSQLPIVGSEQLLNKIRFNNGINGKKDIEYSTISGEPFLFRNFAVGSLIAINDEKFIVEVRYDIYANEMHVKNKEEIFAIIHPEKIKYIEADNLKFVYSPYVKTPGDNPKGDSSYFIVNVDGKCKLLVKKSMRLQDAEPAKLYQEAKPAKFVAVDDSYFLKLNTDPAVKIKNEKDLVTVLSDKSEQLKNFIKTNKLGTGKLEDLNKIVTYYNSL